MATDQPQQPVPGQQGYPAYPTAPQPGYPSYPAGGTATVPPPPAPPASGSSSHVGVIIASIVGGLVLLGLAFGGGAAIGYVVGANHVGRLVMQEYSGPGMPGWQQGGQGPWQGGPMHRHQQQKEKQEQEQEQEQDQQAPTPAPTPSS